MKPYLIASNWRQSRSALFCCVFYAAQSENSVSKERRCLLLRGRSLKSRLVSFCAVISFITFWHVSYVFTFGWNFSILCKKRRTVIWYEIRFPLKRREIEPTFSFTPFNERGFHGKCKFRGIRFIASWSAFMGCSSWLIKKSLAVSNYVFCVLTRRKKISFGADVSKGNHASIYLVN